MLELTIGPIELYNEEKNEFYYFKKSKLILEHSLLSISKWESETHKIFLSDTEKTDEEIKLYIRCMTINKVDENIYNYLSDNDYNRINQYINDKRTATTFSTNGIPSNNTPSELPSSEYIYYAMINWKIPFECEKWHINRLLTLIETCSIKNQPSKKMSNEEICARNKRLNEERKAKLKKNNL